MLPNVKRRKYKTRSVWKRSSVGSKRFETSSNWERDLTNLRNSMKIQLDNSDLNINKRQNYNNSSLIMSGKNSNILYVDQSNWESSRESLQIPMIYQNNRFSNSKRNNHWDSKVNKHIRKEDEKVNINIVSYF